MSIMRIAAIQKLITTALPPPPPPLSLSLSLCLSLSHPSFSASLSLSLECAPTLYSSLALMKQSPNSADSQSLLKARNSRRSRKSSISVQSQQQCKVLIIETCNCFTYLA
ncbi:hypothetical protein NMG60_11019637 [Bertholletia excelsa]